MDFGAIVELFKTNSIEILAVIGAVDLILGIVSKWTPFKWDDNLYAVLHGLISKLLKQGK